MKALRNNRLYTKIAREITDLIKKLEITGEKRLPTERQLAGMLNVSRTTVREALISLETQGLIEIRLGSGIYIVENYQNTNSLHIDTTSSIEELIKVRLLLEVEMAGLAAQNADASQIKLMQSAIDQGWSNYEAKIFHPVYFDDPDRKFHYAIALASSNSLGAEIVNKLWIGMRSPFVRILEHSVQIDQHAELSMIDHEKILMCVREKESVDAMKAMRKHLTRYQKLLTV